MKLQRKRTQQEQREFEQRLEQAGWVRINLTPCAKKKEEDRPDEEEGKPKVPLPDEAETVPPQKGTLADEDPWVEEERAVWNRQRRTRTGLGAL